MGSAHRSNDLCLLPYGFDGSKLGCVLPDKLFDVGQIIHFGVEYFLPEVIIATDGEELENRDASVVEGLDVCFQLQGIQPPKAGRQILLGSSGGLKELHAAGEGWV